MDIEEMMAAARLLFQLLGQEGRENFRANAEVRAELGRLFLILEPRAHAVLSQKKVFDAFDREEIIARIREKLLNMKPITAAHVRDPWPYFHSVIESARIDYLAAVWRVAQHEVGVPDDGEDDGDEGGGVDRYPDERAVPVDRHVDIRRHLEKLERGLRPDELKLLTLHAEGYSARQLVAFHRSIPESQVTPAQEHAMRQRISQILQRAREILGLPPL